jgi:putative membrane protein
MVQGWMFPGLGFLVILVLIVALIWLINSRYYRNRNIDRKNGGEDPLIILKRRYATGEIDREEFQRMKRELDS